MNKYIFTLCGLCFFVLPLFAQLGSIIPIERRSDWTNAGYEGEYPRTITNYVNVRDVYILGQNMTATQAIIQAINDAES